MKQVILVMGHGEQSTILQKTIEVLDDKDIDFFIHWDKKYKQPDIRAKHSTVYFVRPRLNIAWGTDTQIKGEILLLKEAYKSIQNYKMFHLISAVDMPLMDVSYFKKFFNGNRSYLGFDNNSSTVANRVRYYYPFSNINFRTHPLWTKIVILTNRFLQVDRWKKYKETSIYKGPNWFSLNREDVSKVLEANLNKFFHSYCADEVFIQTLLPQLNNHNHQSNDNFAALRYIDWNRGQPYLFQMSDVEELRKVKNTEYAFARKISTPRLIDKVFNE